MGTRRSITGDIGNSGLQLYGGRPFDDFLAEWRGRTKVKKVDEMLKNSPIVAALRMSMELPIRDIEWQFTGPPDVDPDTDPAIQLLNDSLDNLSHSWNDHVIDALLFPFYGWSMFTVTYERVGGQLLWHKFKPLGHDTVWKWEPTDDGWIKGLWQEPQYWTKMIPVERMLIYRFRKPKNSPEGESVLRPAWIPYYFIKHIQEKEGIGIERALAGLPVITPPMGADMTESSSDSTDYGRAHKIVRNVRFDEQAGLILPPPTGPGEHQRWDFKLVSSPGGMSQTIDTNLVISRYEKRLLMSALSQFLMLGMDSVGAMATFEGATDFHSMALNAVADIIAETFTKFAVSRLLVLNGYDPDGYALEHSPAGQIDIPAMADFLQKTGTLLTWTPEDEVWLRSLVRLPEKTAEELAEVQEEKQARQAVMQQAMQQAAAANMQKTQNGQGPEAEPEDEEDEMGAEWFAVDPDATMRKHERKWQRRLTDFLAGQKRRVEREAARQR